MTSIIGRSLALVATLCLGTACSQSDAAKVSQKSESAAVTATANGSLAPNAGTAGVRDSITDKADRGRITGDTSAKVWVVMISDFQCPYCKQWHDTFFAPIMRDYVSTKKVQMAFINFPLSMHPNAVPAAEAAMCASVQNKFWPIHDALFAAQEQWASLQDPTPKFTEIAGKIAGLDLNRWKTCVSKHQTLPLVEADRDRARQAGAQSTPTFVVGGQVLAGSDKDLKAEIEAALKAAPKR